MAACHSPLSLGSVIPAMAVLKSSEAFTASEPSFLQAFAMSRTSSSLMPGVISWTFPSRRPCSMAGRMTSARKSGNSPMTPEIHQESTSSPVPDHLMGLTGPYRGGLLMTTGSG